MFVIPDDFIQKMIVLHGANGLAWIDRLPTILATCEQEWKITIGSPLDNLSYHYVASAVRLDGAPAVVKVCSPTREFAQESEALRLFDGHGMVQLLECDSGNQAMLLERLQPGTPLIRMEDDEKATFIAASIMRQFWRLVPQNHPFPSVQDWGKGFIRLRQYYGGGSGPFPPALLEEAETLFAELSASMAEPVLLHGDLHHDNILSATRQPWLAIDPKGLVGEPTYEVGAWLRNPLPQLLSMPHPGRILARRIDQFAEELGLERGRVRDWGVAQAVLSVWWGIEDTGRVWDDALACAELLAAVKV